MTLTAIGFCVWVVYRALRSLREDTTTNDSPVALVFALVVWLLGGGFVLKWAAELWSGSLAALPKLLVGLIVLLPWPVLRFVLMPLGLVRTAYYFAPLCLLRFQEDLRGGALLLATWTLLQRPATPTSTAAAFIEKRLARVKPLRGAGVVAIALLAAHRGELATTRALLGTFTHLDPTICPAFTYRITKEWLCVDAVARGDWPQVRKLTARRQLYLPLTRFLGSCAARFLPLPASPVPDTTPSTPESAPPPPPRPFTLWWHWLRAPYHQATWPLLQRALRSQPQAAGDPVAKLLTPPPATPSDLRAALAALVALQSTPTTSLTQEQILQACRSWETALTSPATHLQVAKRTLSLGQGDPGATLRELRTQVASAIGARLRDAGLPIAKLLDPAAPPLAATAAHAVRTQLIEEVETTCSALHDRTIDKRALPAPDEWREWAALLARYQRVCDLGGLPVRRLAWGPLYHEACNWACWLWNERQEKVLANAVFRFLLHEAEELHDENRITLARKNVASGI